MADCFVTGIAPTEEVAELEAMLGNVPGVDRSKLAIITKVERSDEHDESFLNFIHAGAPEIDTAMMGHIGGDAIMTSIGGVSNVPGINSAPSTLGYFDHPHVLLHIGNLPIPDDEAENYSDAIDDGRVIVAYKCADSETSEYEGAFHSAGVRHVKTFKN